MTLACPKCGWIVGNVRRATCKKHGPMKPVVGWPMGGGIQVQG